MAARDAIAHKKLNKLLFFNFILLIIIAMFISSCASRVKRKLDGPPNFLVDETKIPNAIPKPEPLAKLGNMPSYRVFGKRYYVMQTGKNYEAVGTASWYGTLFHKRRTSSGEPYNMLAMTAAHKTLPLPTYVEVTNLANQRRIIVKVNDRGPFSGDRVIDLSYVAAKKLGMLGRGTAHVKIKAIHPENVDRTILVAKKKPIAPPYQKIWQQVKTIQVVQTQKSTHNNAPLAQNTITTVTKLKESKQMYLQVGAFRSKVNALKMKERLAGLFHAPISIASVSSKGNLYRVQIGPINDIVTADRITSQLKTLGIKPNKTYGA